MPIRVHTADDALGPPPDQGPPASGARGRASIAEQLVDSIRRVLFSFGLGSPRTVIEGPARIVLDTVAGATAKTTISVGNHQAAAGVVIPALSVLAGGRGDTWTPAHQATVEQRILLPGERTRIDLEIVVDAAVPSGRYCGELVMLGVDGRVPVEVVVAGGAGS